MRTFQQPACVLHVRAWRETSLLLECLTRDHGRVGVVARGARGARSRTGRALLEPFQPLSLELRGTGELATLVAVEMTAPPRRLVGEALLSGLYLNELLVRLLPRSDAQPGLLSRYEAAVARLATGDEVAWTLRRFERDLLATLGYGLQLEHEAESGEAVDPAVDYVYVSEAGPRRWQGRGSPRLRGAALLDFAADRHPGTEALPALRRLLRAEITAQLGDRPLESWRVLDEALRAGRR